MGSKIVPYDSERRGKRVVDDTLTAVSGEWRFSEDVSKAFDSHVRKSVPFYDELQRMVVELSEYFVRDHSVVYDLGSSTGATLKLLSDTHSGKEDVQYLGFDLSESMIKESKAKVSRPNVRFHHQNIMEVNFVPPPNFITALFTLQFLTLAERRTLLARVNEALIEGGGLLIVEKVGAEYSYFEGIWNELHWDFKRRQGLTPEQILEKANSIRGVLNSLTINENLEILGQTGFDRVEVFFKWYNWAGFIAVKNNSLSGRQSSNSGQPSISATRRETRKKKSKRSGNG